jgi:hypothetical protein
MIYYFGSSSNRIKLITNYISIQIHTPVECDHLGVLNLVVLPLSHTQFIRGAIIFLLHSDDPCKRYSRSYPEICYGSWRWCVCAPDPQKLTSIEEFYPLFRYRSR